METEPSLVHTGELSRWLSVNEHSVAYTCVLNCSHGLNIWDAKHLGISPLIVLAACSLTVSFQSHTSLSVSSWSGQLPSALKHSRLSAWYQTADKQQFAADTVYQTGQTPDESKYCSIFAGMSKHTNFEQHTGANRSVNPYTSII